MEKGYPERYTIVEPIEKLRKIVDTLGKLSINPRNSQLYLSEHYRGESYDQLELDYNQENENG